LISARDGTWCDGRHAPKVKYFRYHPQMACGPGDWRPALDTEFRSGHELWRGGATVFFVHGNRISRHAARRRGLAVYSALVQQAVDQRPIRFVIWSWPSDRICGPLKDARIKARRSDQAAYELACVLNGMDPHEPVSLLGFSFGARVITGALHLVAGGKFQRFALDRPVPRAQKLRAVLWTAAIDNDWLLPGRCHGKALSQVDRMLLLNNSCDRAMKWYPLLDRSRRRDALGRCGVASLASLGTDRFKIEQCDACCQLGRQHDMDRYLQQPGLMARAWTCLSFGEPQPVDLQAHRDFKSPFQE
jgi:hypothetical protein